MHSDDLLARVNRINLPSVKKKTPENKTYNKNSFDDTRNEYKEHRTIVHIKTNTYRCKKKKSCTFTTRRYPLDHCSLDNRHDSYNGATVWDDKLLLVV